MLASLHVNILSAISGNVGLESTLLATLNKHNKWRFPARNVAVGDVVILQESGTTPANWPLARIVQVHLGQDNLVRVVTVKTSQGTYTRPVAKIAILIPSK